MPRGDGTGPNGMGPMTGGGFGSCNTNENDNVSYGRGLGCQRGRGFFKGSRQGRGMRNCAGNGYRNRDNYNQDDNSFLVNEIRYLKSKLQSVEKQLENKD